MYRWLLGHENYLSLGDLIHIVPDVFNTLSRLHLLVLQKEAILNDDKLSEEQKSEKVILKQRLLKF